MQNTGKEICKCGNMAVWTYLPGDSSYCDSCVPRGCDCNVRHVEDYGETESEHDGEEDKGWRWIVPGKIWERIDDNGRRFPCCEYMYDEDGFEE
jgi:hypothetical protein